MIFGKRKALETVNRSVVDRDCGGMRIEQVKHKVFFVLFLLGTKTILYDTLLVDSLSYIFVKTYQTLQNKE